MKKLTRVLSVVMAIAMLFTMSMSASAATYTDVKAEDSYYEAVEALSALGVVKGYEAGDFQPEGKITRAEAAAIIMRIMGMAAVENTRINTQFTDVTSEHWASGVIAAAADSAIVNGMGDGTFAPSAEVTYDQVVKMLVCAMGYQKKAEASVAAGTNVFPTGYNIVANQKRITEGTAKTEGGATRGTVARLVYNALTVNLMDQTSFGTDVEFKEVEKASILYTKLNAVEVEAKIATLNLSPEENTVDLIVSKIDKVAEKNEWTKSNFSTIKKGDVDLTGLQGLTVKALVDVSDSADPVLLAVFPQAGKNAELVIAPELFVGFYNDSTKTYTDNIKYYKDADSTTLNTSSKIEAPFTAYINMTKITEVDGLTAVSDVAKEIDKLIGKGSISDISATNHKAYRFVDTDNNGKYDTLFIDNSASFVVGKINATNYQISKATESVYNSNKKYGYASKDNAYSFKPLDLNTEDGDVAYAIADAEGNALAFEDIKAGDILTVAWSYDANGFNYYDITVSSASAVEGTITEVTTETVKYDSSKEITYYVIDGTAYRVNGAANAGKDLEAGSAGTFNITADGTIISFDAVASSKTYGVVIAAGAKTGTFSNGVQVQIMTQDGTIKTFDYAETASVYASPDGKADAVENVITSTTDADDKKDGFQADSKLLVAAGTVVIYETNSDDEIRRIYVDDKAIKAKDNATLASITANSAYVALTGKLDGKFFTEETVIVAIPGVAHKANKDKYSLVSLDALADEEVYEGSFVYNSDREVKFAFITNLAVRPAMNAVPMVITGISTTSVNNETRNKYTGLVDGQEVAYVMAEEVTYVSMTNDVESKIDAAKYTFAIEKNDVIQVVLNANEEIVSYRHLLNWDASAKKYYAMISASYKEDAAKPADDGKGGLVANAEYVELGKVATAKVAMHGAAVADRANEVKNNYVAFENNGDILYDNDVTAYIFGEKYAKAKDISVDSAELLDDYETKTDVDDIVYLYSYDGDNVFAFIWDVMSDNK